MATGNDGNPEEGAGHNDDNLLEIAEDGTMIVRDRSERDTSMSDPIVANDAFPAFELQDENFELAADMDNEDVVSE